MGHAAPRVAPLPRPLLKKGMLHPQGACMASRGALRQLSTLRCARRWLLPTLPRPRRSRGLSVKAGRASEVASQGWAGLQSGLWSFHLACWHCAEQ
eukprot:1704107-Rhodomonas_salina.1